MRVYSDSNIVIYLVEEPPVWGQAARQQLASRINGGDEIVLSDLHRIECLSTPLANHDQALLEDYEHFFTTLVDSFVLLSTEVCQRAAEIRGKFRLKTPDAIHLAAATENECEPFVTNDQQLRRFTGIEVELLLPPQKP